MTRSSILEGFLLPQQYVHIMRIQDFLFYAEQIKIEDSEELQNIDSENVQRNLAASVNEKKTP